MPIARCSGLSRISRIFSPMSVLPGSRKRLVGTLSPSSHLTKSSACVLFPQPSGPSRTINLPCNLSFKSISPKDKTMSEDKISYPARQNNLFIATSGREFCSTTGFWTRPHRSAACGDAGRWNANVRPSEEIRVCSGRSPPRIRLLCPCSRPESCPSGR